MRQVSSDDFDEIAAALCRWDSRFTQLDGGKFAGRLRIADLNQVQLFDVCLNRTVLARGGHPAGAFVFNPVEATNASSVWRGRSLRPGMLNVRRPGDELDHRTGAIYDSTSLLIDGSFLRQCATAFIGVELDDLLPRGGVPMALRNHTTRLARRIRATLDQLALPAGRDPADVVSPLVVDLLHVLSASREVKPARTTSAQRQQIVRQSEVLVVENPGITITPLELCSLTGVSRRTLEYAFLEVTGLSPLAYVKALRLNMARRELQNQRANRGVVRCVACRWGFYRSDHFAADYRRQFGELPSASIGRTTR